MNQNTQNVSGTNILLADQCLPIEKKKKKPLNAFHCNLQPAAEPG